MKFLEHTGWVYNTYVKQTRSMSKDMTGMEKLLFMGSFIWAMHWGVRITAAIFTTLELNYF